MSDQPLLKVRDVSKYYGGATVPGAATSPSIFGRERFLRSSVNPAPARPRC
ncbi:hypothetical protein QE369_004002 [Agrobacterium larrymoorei]|uniref:Uncharacterized protein n=1 Tax=Agrobacterium larrymoorei TaxID=160699 RepID=A0AAJ2BQJ7_9HYPH|nr:hypothetical protein [Agrobacterium larrymoorei]